jgi:hypothetical protein
MILTLSIIRRLRIDVLLVRPESYKGGLPKQRKRSFGSRWIAISDIGEDKSFADDLNTEQGIVSSRVALLLRSAEIKPLLHRFVLFIKNNDPSLLLFQYLVSKL